MKLRRTKMVPIFWATLYRSKLVANFSDNKVCHKIHEICRSLLDRRDALSSQFELRLLLVSQ